jgi:hypothetical protein
MLPGFRPTRNIIVPTFREWSTIRRLRIESLEAAIRLATQGRLTDVTERAGWSSTVTLIGRDPQGDLLLRIACKGPGLTSPYVRNLRLVRQMPLPEL